MISKKRIVLEVALSLLSIFLFVTGGFVIVTNYFFGLFIIVLGVIVALILQITVDLRKKKKREAEEAKKNKEDD